MAGPWEKYQSSEAGPWDNFKSETPQQITPVTLGRAGFEQSLRDTLKEESWAGRNLASAGTAVTNIWEGIKQLVGKENPEVIANNRIMRQEAPVGAVAGDLGMAALPFGMVGNSVKGAAAVGAGMGALQPVEGATDAQSRLLGKGINTAIGGATAAGGQVVANKATDFLAKKTLEAATRQAQRAPIDNTIKEAIGAGYVIPPGQINPTFMNRQLESMGGKIATQQMASSKNQAVTDSLARKAASLSPDAPITPETLKAARDVIKKPYEEIAAVGLQPKLDALDAARSEANAAWREYSRQGTRAALNDFKQFSNDAKALEKEIENSLKSAGKPDLMRKFRDARVALAKNHDVESALIEGGGTVDARAIGRMFQRGDKMTGDLRTIGAFANNFPKVAQPDKAVGTPDAHNLKYILAGALGAGGGMSEDPRLAALGLLPLVSGPAARSAMFSKAAQGMLANPSYAPSVTARVGSGLLGYSPVGATVLGLETLGQ